MTLPNCEVLTHSKWKALRDNAGGKEGISKVNMGEKLDKFHAALKTADILKINPAITSLSAAAKTYVADAKKYPNVIKVVQKEIIDKLNYFVKDLEAKAKEANTAATSVDDDFTAALAKTAKDCAFMIPELEKMKTQYQGIIDRYHGTAPATDKPALAKITTEGITRVSGCDTRVAALNKVMDDLVAKYGKDHPGTVKNFEPKIADAKKLTKKSKSLVDTLLPQLQEITKLHR